MVTGSSKGIGQSITNLLLKEGVKVYGISRTDNMDLSTQEGLEQAKKIIKEINPSILINNVGGFGRKYDFIASYYGAFNINCVPMFELTDEFLHRLCSLNRPHESGRVITISSIYGKEAGLNPFFTAAKAYQVAYMKEMSRKFRQRNITFNTICPGEIDVGKVEKQSHFGKPEDVANLVAFLCSDLAKHINGACITVDGGESYSY